MLGIAGRFWTPRGDVRRLTPAEFARFEDPGYARAVWTFEIEDVAPAVSRLVTQTRVVCNGNRAKRLFRAYWLIVGPFSGFLRREMLRAIRTDAETPERRRVSPRPRISVSPCLNVECTAAFICG